MVDYDEKKARWGEVQLVKWESKMSLDGDVVVCQSLTIVNRG